MPAPPGRRVRGFTLEQPRALEATLRQGAADAARLDRAGAPYREVLLVGSGTSKNALIATAPAFRRAHGCPATVLGPLEFVRDAAAGGPGTLAVVVSQTGVSTTTVEALVAAQARGGRVVALTAEPGSPFGRAARERWLLPIGTEDIGPKTMGYTASLAALLALAAGTAAAPPSTPAAPPPTPAAPPPDAAAYGAWFAASLPAWDALGSAWAERHHGADHVMVVGAGRHVGTALEASLKLQEMAGLPSSAFDLEEALHGRLHGLGPTSLAVFVVGERADEAVALAAADVLTRLGVSAAVLSSLDAGGPAIRLGRFPGDGATPDLDLLAAIVPFQFFAEHAARARGVDPDAMRYPDLLDRLGIKLPNA